MLQGDMKNKQIRIHPTEKPFALYRWIFQTYSKPNFKILDTHLGSASSIVAFEEIIKYWVSQNLEIEGAEFVACELDEDYYKKAIQRIENHISQLTLF